MLIKSCVFHYEFELIHPFSDGNGRMGRLWHTLLLSKWNPLFAWLPVESVIHDRQQEYYDVINASNDEGESTRFIRFMLSAIKSSLNEAAEMSDQMMDDLSDEQISKNKTALDRCQELFETTRFHPKCRYLPFAGCFSCNSKSSASCMDRGEQAETISERKNVDVQNA